RWAMSVGWGDVASAFYSTGIANIETYVAAPPRAIRRIQRCRRLLPLLGFPPIAWLLAKTIDYAVRGPDEQARRTTRAEFWGEVADDAGQRVAGTLQTPSGYHLTVLTALECTQRVLAGQAKPGFSTPAQVFGHQLIESIPDCALCVPAR
ncbi:MAG TPA: hypothetical protein VIK18_08570, partial [Pirellulales bacterium]